MLIMPLLAFLLWGCGANETIAQKPVIKLHDGLGVSQRVNNAIAEFIIEKGYGYQVETVEQSTPAMQEGLPNGTINVNLEGWQQNIIDWYDAELEKGTIINLGMIYEGGPQFFIIPLWVAEEFKIKTIGDMKDHWKLFQDPRDPSKGVFYNCISGWECANINKVKLAAYGLDQYYNIVSPASSTAHTAALENAQKSIRPVFGYYWEPTTLIAAYEWQVLEEPAYTEECWEKVIVAAENESLRPINQACAYENLPIDKLAYAGLQSTAPELVAMLKKMMMGLEPLNRTIAWSVGNQVQDWEKAAVYYLQNYEDSWRSWVTPEAFDKIKKALENTAQEDK